MPALILHLFLCKNAFFLPQNTNTKILNQILIPDETQGCKHLSCIKETYHSDPMHATIREEILARCNAMDIPLVGIASIARWETPLFDPWIPLAFYPHSIWPEAAAVIVIGLPVHLPVLETTPSIWYHEHYNTINRLLDEYTYKIASFLNETGYPSVSVPRDGYGGIEALQREPVAFFSHRHAAYLAGLGTFGMNNMILTKEYGPRVRFGSLFTTAPFTSDPLIQDELCTHCMQCVLCCPFEAISGKKYPKETTDTHACTSYSTTLAKRQISPCGICIKVCPVGSDRERYNRIDTGIYTKRDGNEQYYNAWEHVRRHGHR